MQVSIIYRQMLAVKISVLPNGNPYYSLIFLPLDSKKMKSEPIKSHVSIIKPTLKQKILCLVTLLWIVLACSCKKHPSDAPLGNLSSILIAYKWQLLFATQYDNSGMVTSVYKGKEGDSLFFEWQPDSNFNVKVTNIETFVGGNYATFGYTLKQLGAATTNKNFIICSQTWKVGYADTVRIMPFSSLLQQYIVFKIGRPYDSATEGYEIDSLSIAGPSDR